jgi:exonuclease SbcD
MEMLLDGIYVYKNMDTIIIDTTAFTLMPYRDRKSFSVASNAEAVSLIKDSLLYELSGIPNTYKKVAIGHLTLEGAIPVGDEIDDIADAMFCKLDMFDKYDYVWMGHVHKPQVLKQNPHIAHIGSMDISNFLESDQKKIVVIFDTNLGKFETINIPTRNLHKLSLVVPADIEDTTEYVLNELIKNKDLIDKSTIKVEVSLSSPSAKSINKSIVDNYLVSNGAFNVTGIYESKKIMSVKKDNTSKTINTSTDILSAIKTFAENNIEEDIRSEYIEAATEIINSYNMGQ